MAFQDIRKQVRQSLTPADMAFLLGALVVLGALFALNLYVARTYQGGEWLYLRWSAMRALLFDGVEPYGATVAQGVQLLVYGRDAYLNEYPFALNDPFYIALLYIPLAWLFSDFVVVHALWMLLSQAALVGSVLLIVHLSELAPPRWLVGLLICFALFNYHSVSAMASGSPTIFLIFLYLGVLFFLKASQDEIAGVLLVLIGYQWEVGALFFVFVVVLLVAHRRWGVFAGVGMTLIVLLGISFLTDSGWMWAFAQAVLYTWNHSVDYTFIITLAYIFPEIVLPPGRWLALIFGGLFFAETLTAVNASFRHIIWAMCLALTLNPLLGWALFPSNLVVYVPAITLVILLIRERWIRQPWISAFAWLLASSLAYGFYYLQTQTDARLYADVEKVALPLLVVLCLYWMRWWAVRPPRLWADQFGARK